MGIKSIPKELAEARKLIDQIDEDLVGLLARRFALTRQVGMLKAANSLDAVDPDREARKLETMQALAQAQNLNPKLVTDIFAQIMAEAVRNHRRLKGVR
ncbi:MAG: chorismate mutase [Pseudohongiellaceae bacterium]